MVENIADTGKKKKHNYPSNRQTTDQQNAFIEAFTSPDSPTQGHVTKSKLAAGYNANYSTTRLISHLRDELIDSINDSILLESVKSYKALTEVRDNPTTLGASSKLKAADSLLDRAGIVKKTQMEIKQDTPSTILIIPSKDTSDDEDI